MLALIFILVLLIPLLAVVLDSQLGRALARRVEGGAPDSARLAALESEVERLSAELLRLQEQTDFLDRLLAERAAEPGRLGPGPAGGSDGEPADPGGRDVASD